MIKALSKKEIEIIKKTIEEQLNALTFLQDKKHEDLNLQCEDLSDEVDLANSDVTNGQRIRFMNRENLYKKKLKIALERIQRGHFGICEDCEGPINFSRLKARPTADLCISCKEDTERDEVKNIANFTSKSLGKQLQAVQEGQV